MSNRMNPRLPRLTPRFAALRKQEERSPTLDGLRGLAILLVVVWHYVGVPLPPAGVHQDGSTWIPTAKGALIICRGGVDVFFVLSGYLIAGILLRNQHSRRYYAPFFIRRACRILPLYSVLVAVFIMCRIAGYEGVLFDGPIPLAAYITMTQNYGMAAMGTYGAVWLSATWSLAIEEQFYLLFPALVRILGRWLPALLAAGIVGAPLLRLEPVMHFERERTCTFDH